MKEELVFLHSFWIKYPEADVIPQFNAIRKKRGDEASSRIMFYIRFLFDPEHEYLFDLPKENREALLIDYCKMKKTDLTSQFTKEAMDYYSQEFMSKPKRAFASIGRKIEEADKALDQGTIYAPSDIAIYVGALKSLKELKREYDSAKAEFLSDIKTSTKNMYGKKDTPVGRADDGSLFSKFKKG